MAVIFISFLLGLPTSIGLVLSHDLGYLQASGIMLVVSVVLPVMATLGVLVVQRVRARMLRSNASFEHAGPN